MIKIGIVGGTGYTGIELLRILAQHPQSELVAITSRKEAGTPRSRNFSRACAASWILRSRIPRKTDLSKCDVVFFATPNSSRDGRSEGASGGRGAGRGSFGRFSYQECGRVWEKWYKVKHAAPELLSQAVLWPSRGESREDQGGAPGRQPGMLSDRSSARPAALGGDRDPWISRHLIADAKSGVSGAGKRTEEHLLFSEASDNFKAYGVSGHRHWPEILQGLDTRGGHERRVDVRAASGAHDSGISTLRCMRVLRRPSIFRESTKTAIAMSLLSTCFPAEASPTRVPCARRIPAASRSIDRMAETRSSCFP